MGEETGYVTDRAGIRKMGENDINARRVTDMGLQRIMICRHRHYLDSMQTIGEEADAFNMTGTFVQIRHCSVSLPFPPPPTLMLLLGDYVVIDTTTHAVPVYLCYLFTFTIFPCE